MEMEFPGISFAAAEESPAGLAYGESQTVKVVIKPSATGGSLQVFNQETDQLLLVCTLRAGLSLKLSSSSFLLKTEAQQSQTYVLKCASTEAANQLEAALNVGQAGGANVFDHKTDSGSSELYFHYYGMLQHQQNMLQDFNRTGTYYAAILENRADFEGKVVMDVGAGSGILSLFAAQAGAKKVYAVEASDMAKFARRLAAANTAYGKALEVVQGKVEEVELPEKVDVLVSEPMGTLLVNERMLETYLYARDHFLKPGGKMYPQIGRIQCAAFSDHVLHSEIASKGSFWTHSNFYGVDLTSLYQPAVEGYFSQVVVDAFDPQVLVSAPHIRIFDFMTTTEKELLDISIPLDMTIDKAPVSVHGLACWFDVIFCGSTIQRWLSTAPGLPTTHWFQLRCVLQHPILISSPGQKVTGMLRLVAHARQSYDILVDLEGPPLQPNGPPQKASGKLDLKEPYYRQLTSWYQQPGGQGGGNPEGEGVPDIHHPPRDVQGGVHANGNGVHAL